MASLLLGCGNDHSKRIYMEGKPEWSLPLTKLDMDPYCGANVIHDMNQLPLPFADEEFDEIGAYDVLEHWGAQGDWRRFFDEFAEYWRILKPGGMMQIIVPIGTDWFADIGHTRFFEPNSFDFLSQAKYAEKLGKGMNVTDYRWYWKRDFHIIFHQVIGNHHLAVVLRKP